MDVFMLTSLWRPAACHPQALAMGLPVLANRAKRHGRGDPGWADRLPVPGNSGYGRARVELAADPAERQAMGQAGQAFARQEFDLRRMIAQIEALYEALMKLY
jgi:glycosyltransferase involved in cell wall biosynthesis